MTSMNARAPDPDPADAETSEPASSKHEAVNGQQAVEGRVKATDESASESSAGADQVAAQPALGDLGPGEKPHSSIFNGLDAAARSFLGPAERIDGSLPVNHRHDAQEDASDETLRHVEVRTDSSGHRYAQRTSPDPSPEA